MSELTSTLLAERGTTHGEFRENSGTSQNIKNILRAGAKWHALHAYQREALDMIAHKIGRLLSGDPHFQDHWDDIAGYARLAADRVREDQTAKPEPQKQHVFQPMITDSSLCMVCGWGKTNNNFHLP